MMGRLSKLDRHFLFCICGLSILAVGLYHSFFVWLLDQWLTDRLYSQGILVPPVSLYFVWARRDRLRARTVQPAPWLGILLLIPSAIALVAGRWGAYVLLESVSFLFFLPGMILLLWGVQYLLVLIMPLLYLQLMVPWFDPILPRIQEPFQFVSAQMSVWLFKALGIPVFHDGVYIALPNLTLAVARECSGVHFVLSVMTVAIPIVYLTQRTWLRSAIVLASGVVITLLANGLRITIDGCLGMRYGTELLHGPGHLFRGWFAAQVGWVGVLIVNVILVRGSDRNLPRLCDRWRRSYSGESPRRNAPLRPLLRFGGFLLLFLFILEVAAPAAVPLRAPLREFPRSFGRWTGRAVPWLEVAEMFPGMDESVSMIYKDKAGGTIRLFLGYFQKQRSGKALLSRHSAPLHEGAKLVATSFPPPWPSHVGKGWMYLGENSYLTSFWYQLPESGSPRKAETKLAVVRDALQKHRTAGMVIVAAVPGPRSFDASTEPEVPPDFLEQIRAHLPAFMHMQVLQ